MYCRIHNKSDRSDLAFSIWLSSSPSGALYSSDVIRLFVVVKIKILDIMLDHQQYKERLLNCQGKMSLEEKTHFNHPGF